jgi:hypothetical protein
VTKIVKSTRIVVRCLSTRKLWEPFSVYESLPWFGFALGPRYYFCVRSIISNDWKGIGSVTQATRGEGVNNLSGTGQKLRLYEPLMMQALASLTCAPLNCSVCRCSQHTKTWGIRDLTARPLFRSSTHLGPLCLVVEHVTLRSRQKCVATGTMCRGTRCRAIFSDCQSVFHRLYTLDVNLVQTYRTQHIPSILHFVLWMLPNIKHHGSIYNHPVYHSRL